VGSLRGRWNRSRHSQFLCADGARLERTRRDIRISSVEYLDSDEAPVGERNLAAALIRKARCYAIEQEVRMFLSKVPLGTEATFWGEPGASHVAVPVTLPYLISAIALGPNTSAMT